MEALRRAAVGALVGAYVGFLLAAQAGWPIIPVAVVLALAGGVVVRFAR